MLALFSFQAFKICILGQWPVKNSVANAPPMDWYVQNIYKVRFCLVNCSRSYVCALVSTGSTERHYCISKSNEEIHPDTSTFQLELLQTGDAMIFVLCANTASNKSPTLITYVTRVHFSLHAIEVADLTCSQSKRPCDLEPIICSQCWS